ncbi:MAG: sigma-70 family RNA polymerase sigma factor [Planctomycetota bacterium]
MTATRSFKSLDELDRILDRYAADPEGFAAKARRRAQDWNRQDYDLALRDPLDWRKPVEPETDTPARSGVASIEEQLRAEIDNFTIMDRVEEARHARRIEFARFRLDHALQRAGMSFEDVEGKVGYDPTTYRHVSHETCELPAEVCRRWLELHHLRTELVERNLYLAIINVERYAHLGVSRLDLIQEGSAALFRAVDGFDWRRGLLFRTYAVHWLNQAYRSYLYNNGQTVRVPVYLQKAMKHVRAAIDKLGPDASVAQIAEEADLGEHLVESALAASRSTLSIDSPFSAGDDASGGLAEVLGQADESGVYSTAMEEVTLESGIHDAMDRLSERERFVIEMRFGINREREHTLSEVAAELGVSLERVRQIQVRAISKMKTPHLRKAIDPFL